MERRTTIASRRRPEIVIAGDFGATHKRLRATRYNGSREIVLERTGHAADYRSLTAFISSFLDDAGDRPDAIAIGVPGRIEQGRRTCWLSYIDSNVPFGFALPGLPDFLFLNDLEAGALALADPVVSETVIDLRTGQQAAWKVPAEGFCLVAPGTGVGVAFGRSDGHVNASEGGNLLAPLNLSDPAERHLARSAAPWPTYEQTFDFLASGAGLFALLRASTETERDPIEREETRSLLAEVQQLPAEVRGELIAKAAHSPSAPRVAVHALELFGRILARCAQAALLTSLAPTLVLAGGVAAANADLFSSNFLSELERHPRHRRFLSQVRVQLCPNPTLNLDGAESFAQTAAVVTRSTVRSRIAS
jgi:glucokinase